MLIATIIFIVGLVLAAAFAWPHRLIPLLKIIYPEIVWETDRCQKLVALSFDDGPDPLYTPAILDQLRTHGVLATFFVVGERVAAFPALAERICAEGHELGNHSHTWKPTLLLSTQEFRDDVSRSEREIAAFPCSRRLFRPAGIWVRKSQLAVLDDLGYRCVLGSAYGHDPKRPPAAFISWVISRALRPGAIIVLHDSGGDRSNTVAALPAVLHAAKRKGLQVCRVSELLEPR